MTSADAEQTRGVLFWLFGSLSGHRARPVPLPLDEPTSSPDRITVMKAGRVR